MPRPLPSQAINNPVNSPAPELSTADMQVGQMPDIVLRNDEPIDHEQLVIPVDRPLESEYIKALKFAEEPVTIRIERSSEKFAPLTVDCWVNGIGAEVFMRGKWLQLGYLPVGYPIITKRKYVEVLARSKVDSVQTDVQKREDSEDNIIQRHTSQKSPFSILKDDNPLGHEWLTRLLAEG